jgi:hypothetical protein
MKVKIDEKIICIPPYISTTWEQITFLQSEEDPESHLFTLFIHLNEGNSVRIPNLDSSLIDIAFAAHLKHLEKKPTSSRHKGDEGKTIGSLLQQLTGLSPEQLAHMPIRFGFGGIEGMTGMEVLQHNQAQANSPDMPKDVLEKVSGMIKMMTNGELSAFPKPEPHCNCPHCQVARAIHEVEKEEENGEIDNPISDEELSFRDWEITKKGDQLYIVTNPLDSREHYSVFLGTPIGCTCGEAHCEHIKAVLYS